MGRPALIEAIEAEQLKKEIPEFRIGDNLKISFKIIEGGKERIQSLTGTVVARKGSGLSENITLYRTAYGSAMERVFMLHSPRITDIAVVRKGKVRRSKLYYICGVMGKASKVKERIGKKSIVVTEDVKAETNNTAAEAENN
ncbi:MAG: 50S ribosomal protein L19 [Simkaniaceae bacterium]|nr:50S ribosomal protein L19 [Simkaniaceae bacterium]